jgi:hypothetical protein
LIQAAVRRVVGVKWLEATASGAGDGAEEAMTAMENWARRARGQRAGSGGGAVRWVLTTLWLAVALAVPGGSAVAAQGACQTPFVVYTDPANPGTSTQNGDVAVSRGGHLLGEYGGNGRFGGYAIDGSIDTIVNTATGKARVQGEFTATSPDGGSSITVWYTGQVDFNAAVATGNFVAGSGTGADAGYRAAGTIEGDVMAPATLAGVDVGLC